MTKGRILIIDDEVILTDTLQNILSTSGYDAFVCNNGEEFFSKVAEVNPDLILLDIFMGKKDLTHPY
jgi:DNA-binding response OmpR family regulator